MAVERRSSAAGSWLGLQAGGAGSSRRGAWCAASRRPSSVARRTMSGATDQMASKRPSGSSHPASTAADAGASQTTDHSRRKGSPAGMAISSEPARRRDRGKSANTSTPADVSIRSSQRGRPAA